MAKTKTAPAAGKRTPPVDTRPSTKPETVDQAIREAQRGKVSVSTERAVEMAGTLYAQGRYDQAEKVCRQLLRARPNNADAHNILGVALNGQGRSDEAVEILRKAIALAPTAAGIHSNLGEVLRQRGDVEEASEVLEQATKLEPDNAQAWNNLGITYFERRMIKRAIAAYRRAVEISPEMAEAHNNLGNALRQVGNLEGALHAYQDALTYRERYPEAYNNLGTLLQQEAKLEEAEHALKKAIQQNNRYIEAYNNLAQLYVAQKKDVEALRILGDALKFAPKSVSTLLITARVQLRRNNLQAAEQATRAALNEQPENAEALTVLGQILHDTDRYDEALEALEQAIKHSPKNPETLNFYGVALKSVGRLEEAREHMLGGLRGNPLMYGAYANISDLVDFSEGEGEDLFNKMDEIFAKAGNSEVEPYLALHFAYAKALDDRGEHQRALEHYVTGGKMKRAQLTYNEEETLGFFDSIRAAFPKEVFEKRSFAGNPDDRPVFIIGMPRSGSTLAEQILSSHPAIYGAGEVKYFSYALGRLRDRFPFLPKYPELMGKITPPQMDIVAKNYIESLTATAGDAKRVTDKLLTNFFFAGLINLLFPNAKIIHTRRDPVDTCLSGFTKLFKDDMPHSYDLGELGRYYAKYLELMEHWEKVLPEGFMTTVLYEDVVGNTEKEARRLIEFLGLPWDPKCVDFHKSDRPVKTASVAQVRKPIYNTSVKRWMKYGDGLQPLIDAVAAKPAKKTAAKKPKAKAKENA